MFKCVYNPCEEDAEYVYLGMSLCKFHFKQAIKEAVETKKRAEEKEKDASQRSKGELE